MVQIHNKDPIVALALRVYSYDQKVKKMKLYFQFSNKLKVWKKHHKEEHQTLGTITPLHVW